MVTVWAGLSVGAIYVLVAVGLNVVFVASGSFNFAQPQYLMAGTFIAYWVSSTLGLSPWLAIIIGAGIGGAVSVVEERVAVRPISGSGVHGELVTTVGWSVVMQGLVLVIWGSEPRRVEGIVPRRIVEVFGGRLTVNELVLIGLALAIAVGAHMWTRRTLAGLACLATAEDRDAATLRGVNVRLYAVVAFAVAGALLAGLGPIVGPKTFAIFSLGGIVILKSFFAMAMGGFGSYLGALAGGLGLGLFEAFTNRHVGTEYVNPLVFVLLMTVLMLWPSGLFGEQRERVV